ncbi:MAG: CocE/NonD family hydrolase, partial [Gammaproteobacteria bacterium]
MKKLLFISALMFSFSGWADEDNITEVRITMSDGIQLAADIYWPAGADKNDRFPILLEYLPYRKDESRAR